MANIKELFFSSHKNNKLFKTWLTSEGPLGMGGGILLFFIFVSILHV
jgi:hypothetical protein